MGHTPHELAEDFPEYADKLHTLKERDSHFARLADEYHAVNRAVHRAETDVTPMDDLAVVDMRKKRSALKDEIFGILKSAG